MDQVGASGDITPGFSAAWRESFNLADLARNLRQTNPRDSVKNMFEGRVALITGGSSGIGRAAALAFAEQGACVVVASRRAEESEETVRLIVAAGGDALFVKTDVAHAEQVAALVDKTVATYGGLDFAFNNAGIEGTAFVPAEHYKEETWDSVMDINAKGVFLSMKYELPHVVARKGAIVNMASVAGLRGSPMGMAYAASKHAVVGMTRAAAVEYAPTGVRINAVAPAVIVTPMAERAFFHDPNIRAAILARHPLGRLGEPEEVAQAVIWLCSPGASYTTGHTLPIDGGMLA
jgi:NAD(P)-dependent dehydrogenase (short-subunit alcohol dehydrogenase family)